jgi:hypothetical protein
MSGAGKHISKCKTSFLLTKFLDSPHGFFICSTSAILLRTRQMLLCVGSPRQGATYWMPLKSGPDQLHLTNVFDSLSA